MSEWQPIETAPYSTSVLGFLYLPKNPHASNLVIASRCYVTEDEPESYGDQRMTVGCWFSGGRYYHANTEGGYITHWMPLPPPPKEPEPTPDTLPSKSEH